MAKKKQLRGLLFLALSLIVILLSLPRFLQENENDSPIRRQEEDLETQKSEGRLGLFTFDNGENFRMDESNVDEDKLNFLSKHLPAELRSHQNKLNLYKLGEIVQRKINILQHPPDCTKVQKLYCENKGICGLGCMTTHFLSCLYLGYYTKRTVIINSNFGILKGAGGYNQWFYPFTSCKESDVDFNSALDIRTAKNVLNMGKVNNSHPLWCWKIFYTDQPDVCPLGLYNGFHRTLPDNLSFVRKYTRHPEAWFAGQFVKYLLFRFKPHVQEMIEKRVEEIGYTHPIVGIQVRHPIRSRTDMKIPFEQYIQELENYFDLHYPNLKERRVYLSTDQHKPFQYFKSINSRFTLLHQNISVATKALKMEHAHNDDSFLGLLVDIYLLINADGLIATLNSNFGTMLFQLRMATWNHDIVIYQTRSMEENPEWLLSLHFKNERAMLLVVKEYQSIFPKDMNLSVGDLIIDPVLYYNWDSVSPFLVYSRGRKYGTNEKGRYPVSHVVRYPEDSLKYLVQEDI